MFCPKCGKQLSDGARFCSECGSTVTIPVATQQQGQQGQQMQQPASGASRGGVSFNPAKGLPMIGVGIAVFIACSIIQAVFGSSMFSLSYVPSRVGILGAILINLTWWPGWLVTAISILGGIGTMFKSPEAEKKELLKKAEAARIKGDTQKAEELEAKAREL
jgi:flagellar biosynthesis protein FliQ